MNPLVSFLSRPESYPHGPGSVTLVETHASWVFLAPPYVFKVKKPVNLGFLDFSTLDKRRHFCLQEVALNRRLAPETYLGVEGIVRREGGFGFGTDGEVVEYAVKMRRLDPRYFLDRLMEQGAVGTRELDRIIERLASFYRAQKPTPEVEAWGGIDRLRISTDENFRQAAELGEAGRGDAVELRHDVALPGSSASARGLRGNLRARPTDRRAGIRRVAARLG